MMFKTFNWKKQNILFPSVSYTMLGNLKCVLVGLQHAEGGFKIKNVQKLTKIAKSGHFGGQNGVLK